MAVEILSVKLDRMDSESVRLKVLYFLEHDGASQITPVNPEFIMATRHDPALLEIVNKSDLNLPDGVGLKFAARFFGVDIGERITGIDLTWEIAKIAAEKGLSIFLLGAAEGIAEKAAASLTAVYPTLKIAGTYAGTPDERGVVDRINGSGADILLVAFGVPKQEKFIFANKGSLRPRVAMSVGGTFDFIAGVIPRAPRWMRTAGLEWAFRLVKQPKRIKRIVTATVLFPLAVMRSRLVNSLNHEGRG